MRLSSGGRVDRSQPLRFTLDGAEYVGFRGDTLASAMIGAGVLSAGPSIYRGRPRGILTADLTEPNALVQLSEVQPATVVELVEGLSARSLSGIGRLAPEPVEAHYDKKFVHADVLVVGAGPAGLAAAQAAAAGAARVLLIDDQSELGGDLLSSTETVDGAPALDWIARVRAELAGRPEVTILSRASVFGHYDQNYVLALERRTEHLDAAPEGVSRQRVWHIRARRVVLATGARERPLVFADNDRPGIMLASAVRTYLNRYAVVPGQRIVVATTNDHAYQVVRDLQVAGVPVAALVDSRPAGPTTVAAAVAAGGTEVIAGAVVSGSSGDASGRLSGVAVRALDASGQVVGPARDLPADVLAVSGGWSPDVHLFSQSRGTLRWDDGVAGFVPHHAAQAVRCAGAAAGVIGLAACQADGAAAGAEAAALAGFPGAQAFERSSHVRVSRPSSDSALPEAAAATAVAAVAGPADLAGDAGIAHPLRPPAGSATRGQETESATSEAGLPPRPVWLVPGPEGEPADWHTHFVDLHRDATVADIWRATGAGMRSLEHVKRYTTIGTGHDQGATSGVLAAGLVAQALSGDGSGSPGDLGTTTFRAPSVPVLFAALAGRDVDELADPVRTTPIHPGHAAAGAVFEDVGQWKRPWYYPRAGEDLKAAVLRECRAARTGVAMMDASTLGKIEVVGPDAGEFLNRIYTNAFAKLPVGSARYGVMCTADGMVMDDGVTMRLAEDRFYLTTTTGGAARVLDWMEEWHQTEWPQLRITFTSVTEQWATIAVVGPRSREVVGRLAPALDVANAAFPFMTFRDTEVRLSQPLGGGQESWVPARIARISFSGELAYEINVAGWYGLAVWQAIAAAGADLGITPYGTETMHVLRAEKGFPIVGQDTDGTVTPYDLGMGWVVSRKKSFVGQRSLRRADTVRPDRKQLVGLLPVDPDELLPEGAQLVAADVDLRAGPPIPMLGHVTSSYHSAALERTFALALVKGGRARIGETVLAPLADRAVAATITEPVFYDPEGARRDG